MKGEQRIRMAAPPERVWALVADVTRMGEWSPECRRCEWLDGGPGPRTGARFRGHNRAGPFRWTTLARVTACDPGRDFAFVTEARGRELTRWRYVLEAAGNGTQVTESYEVMHVPLRARAYHRLTDRAAALDRGMRLTLERIKAAAEGE